MTDNILNIYKNLKNKGKFTNDAADEFGVRPSTMKIHWIHGGMIPEEKQNNFHMFIINWAKQEIERMKANVKENS